MNISKIICYTVFTSPVSYVVHSSSVDFVLKDPSQRDKEKTIPKTPARRELDVVPKPWAKSVEASYRAISQLLFVTNPTLRQVLSLWYKSYSHMRLVNTRSLLTHGEVIDLAVYQAAIMKDVETVKNLLLKRYTQYYSLVFYVPSGVKNNFAVLRLNSLVPQKGNNFHA